MWLDALVDGGLKCLHSECNSVSNHIKLHKFIAFMALNISAKLQLGWVYIVDWG